jgi:hypothetical protein
MTKNKQIDSLFNNINDKSIDRIENNSKLNEKIFTKGNQIIDLINKSKRNKLKKRLFYILSFLFLIIGIIILRWEESQVVLIYIARSIVLLVSIFLQKNEMKSKFQNLVIFFFCFINRFLPS